MVATANMARSGSIILLLNQAMARLPIHGLMLSGAYDSNPNLFNMYMYTFAFCASCVVASDSVVSVRIVGVVGVVGVVGEGSSVVATSKFVTASGGRMAPVSYRKKKMPMDVK